MTSAHSISWFPALVGWSGRIRSVFCLSLEIVISDSDAPLGIQNTSKFSLACCKVKWNRTELLQTGAVPHSGREIQPTSLRTKSLSIAERLTVNHFAAIRVQDLACHV